MSDALRDPLRWAVAKANLRLRNIDPDVLMSLLIMLYINKRQYSTEINHGI
jgi:hypothetical protein